MMQENNNQVPWGQPMDELSEHNIRQVIGLVRRGVVGLLQCLDGLEEWLPINYDFWVKHPDFERLLSDSSAEEITQNLRDQRQKLAPAIEALDYMISDEMLPVYKIISQPGYGKMVTGIANLILFLKQFGLRETGQE
jgi:hypothetical protein